VYLLPCKTVQAAIISLYKNILESSNSAQPGIFAKNKIASIFKIKSEICETHPLLGLSFKAYSQSLKINKIQ